MNLTLVVLAAGMGSRFGGPKQLAELSGGDDTITDYNVYDARRAGFNKVVFVVRRSIEADFQERIAMPWRQHLQVEVVCQDEPSASHHRSLASPGLWGTTDAVLKVAHLVGEPFAVVNADDYYGPQAFGLIADFFSDPNLRQTDSVLLGYPVTNTLSEHGPVTRALCQVDDMGNLVSLQELRGIQARDGLVFSEHGSDRARKLDPTAVVSMNCWGLQPGIFRHLSDAMDQFFLRRDRQSPPSLSESLLPEVISDLVAAGRLRTRVERTQGRWFGLTFEEDLVAARSVVSALIRDGVYPKELR